MRLVISVVVDVAPVEYGQERGLPSTRSAEEHAATNVPALLADRVEGLGAGLQCRVTEVLVNP